MEPMACHTSGRRKGQHVLKTADAHRAALDGRHPHSVEEGFDILRFDVAVPVKVREEAPVVLRLRKVYDQHASSRREHATYFARALLAHRSREVTGSRCGIVVQIQQIPTTYPLMFRVLADLRLH